MGTETYLLFTEDEHLLTNLSKKGVWFPSCSVFRLKLGVFRETLSQIQVIQFIMGVTGWNSEGSEMILQGLLALDMLNRRVR